MLRRTVALAAAAALVAAAPIVSRTAAASAPTPDQTGVGKSAAQRVPAGPFSLGGAKAAGFRLPADVVRVSRNERPDGGTSTRYQQMVGNAAVLNGQITVIRAADGTTMAVVGAHYPGLTPTNTARLSPAAALRTAAERHGAAGATSTDLRIDPRDGRLFYIVDQIRPASRWVSWVDAGTGRVTRSYNAITEGEKTGTGLGVKGDTKRFSTVRRGDGPFLLQNLDSNGAAVIGDSRRSTENSKNTLRERGNVLRDANNVWRRIVPLYVSPDQRPGVDAHYYAGVVDDYYADVFGRNSIDDEGMAIRSVVHFYEGYCNAFWNGLQMTYGDGDGKDCLPLSGALDVVGHELTHGVTEFTSGLIYQDESGALNEAFSDMMGNSIEFYAARNDLDPAARPDWRIGEDVIIPTRGFRNMGDPQEFGDPDHYTELYRGPADSGGVHTNSGIPNHAYYLTVKGGRNAGCTGSASGHTHRLGCDIVVDGIGVARAEQIFYGAFTGLTEYANFCDARNATVALAGYDGVGDSVRDAWAAVGVRGGCRPGLPPPPACISDGDAELPFGSPHPYGNKADCLWRYDNGEAGFRFRFSLLSTEEGFDYVTVQNGAGRVLASYTGTYDTPKLSPCIRTPRGIVTLDSDSSATEAGFTINAVRPC